MSVYKTITKLCSQCHKSFHPSSNRSLQVNNPCCSLTCRYAYKRSIEYISCKFWDRVDKGSLESCWLWQGRIDPRTGYGQFSTQSSYIFPENTGHSCLSHRVAYFLYHKTIDKALLVCHRCDTRLCCNPSHLFQGTHKDNAQDMKAKGRSLTGDRNWTRQYPERVLHGENHPMARLSDNDAQAIYAYYNTGEWSQRALAEEFCVTQYTIWRIVNKKRKGNLYHD